MLTSNTTEPKCLDHQELWYLSDARLESETNMETLCPTFGSPTFDSAPLRAMALPQPVAPCKERQCGGPFLEPDPSRLDTENHCIISNFLFDFLDCGTTHVRPSERHTG
jgi:hypothetical protein